MDLQGAAAPEAVLGSYCCAACEVNWWPHQADHGRCPMCGGDSIYSEKLASDDADLLYRIVHAERPGAASVPTSTTTTSGRTTGNAARPEAVSALRPAGP
jgi:hypothetical protein